ncbi:MAG: pyruvate kinase [Gemmatimonadota bacterium]|nr:pyruvate kinase [Gemmatimonadota bacterium]
MPTDVRRTKIVATLGPAWTTPAQMHQLLDAGVNVVRINASHGTPEERSGWIRDLQAVQRDRSTASAILVDLQGPRIRVGALTAPLVLISGAQVVFAPEARSESGEIPTTYEDLAGDVRTGSRILLDDGLMAVTVTRVQADRVHATVVHGGTLKSSKGMNLPGVEVSAPAITDRDREEAIRAVALGVDYIALSFVRRPQDMVELRRLVSQPIRLVAKIEKDTALQHLEGILQVSDAIMVARGDLGVELPFEQVPLAQKHLIREANRHGKPVITATQMLESMISAPRPTRAEASDVANAILDGTDALMLSAETAVGKYPVEAVSAMDRIAREVEHQRSISTGADLFTALPPQQAHAAIRTEDAISVGVRAAVSMLNAPIIVCFTSSGFTARTVASYRPGVPIFAMTPEPETFRQLALVWGVVPVISERFPTYISMFEVARERLLALGLAEPGDRVVVTAGVPFDQPGTTNLLKIEVV